MRPRRRSRGVLQALLRRRRARSDRGHGRARPPREDLPMTTADPTWNLLEVNLSLERARAHDEPLRRGLEQRFIDAFRRIASTTLALKEIWVQRRSVVEIAPAHETWLAGIEAA